MGEPLSHVDEEGRARMVDVSAKEATRRVAVAEAFVRMARETAERVRGGALAKGDVLAVARVAGIQGAKRTAELIPLCHPIRLDDVDVEASVEPDGVRLVATATAVDRTGVEMEAMTACAVAALTVYDMVKGADRSAAIESVRLLEKQGGRSGTWRRSDPDPGLR